MHRMCTDMWWRLCRLDSNTASGSAAYGLFMAAALPRCRTDELSVVPVGYRGVTAIVGLWLSTGPRLTFS